MFLRCFISLLSICAAAVVMASGADGRVAASGRTGVYLLEEGCPWSAVNVYLWDAGNANKEYLGPWPGCAAGLMSIDGVRYFHVSVETSDVMIKPMIIFNGDGVSGDFDFVGNGIYTLDGFTGRTVDCSSEPDVVEDGCVSVDGREVRASGLIEVYNLQGVRVACGRGSAELPCCGVFIVRTHCGVSKVVR